MTPATCVHHIIPIETEVGNPTRMRQLAYSPKNLMSLCEPCHHDIHRELASGGKEATKARHKARTGAFVANFLKGENNE